MKASSPPPPTVPRVNESGTPPVMVKPICVFFAPFGALLMVSCIALIPYRMLSLVADKLQPTAAAIEFTSLEAYGGLGAVLFGLGMVSLMVLRRLPTELARRLLLAAALLMVVAAVSNLFGDWLMFSAFRDLATASSVDPDGFLDSFESAKYPMLAGYGLLFLATLLIVAAAIYTSDLRTPLPRLSTLASIISFVVLLLAVFWTQTAASAFGDAIAGESVEPSRLASSVSGALNADFLIQVSVIGFALATLILAVKRPPALETSPIDSGRNAPVDRAGNDPTN
ncbi:hypothetical protein FYK55_02465 [Roseiconus nitratireducens]|uniref:Uncharacterized protein n=1 Tax=Roseiconus nitratireducens TaxID=2605748 RepID=A0A5M6DM30_9BACT|nr:hypothetical protein [Roseiconus nitratireducens]KAA5547279.1 hypothetical protein FYK55_02465 [Roseiconus nitratireducens]